jgi:hypothetical protein
MFFHGHSMLVCILCQAHNRMLVNYSVTEYLSDGYLGYLCGVPLS